jgi:hypothetical protein
MRHEPCARAARRLPQPQGFQLRSSGGSA